MHPNPFESPEVFRQQIQTLFEEASLEVNELLFWAERAQGNTYGRNEEEAIAWYNNAMLIYDFLERREQKPFMSRIYMRLNIIRIYGWQDERSKPYLEEISNWILNDLPEKTDQVKTEAEHWQQLPVERIRALRDLNVKLKIAQQLKENGVTLSRQILACIPLSGLLP